MDQPLNMEESSGSKSEETLHNTILDSDTTEEEQYPEPDYLALRIMLHEILHKELRTELFKNYRADYAAIEPHDFNQELKFQPLFRVNTRRDYIMNRFQLILKDTPGNDRYVQMEQNLNKTYNDVRRHQIKELCFPPSLVNKPGTIVVVFDTFRDHIGRFKRAKIVECKAKLKNVVICQLIDEGVITSFPIDQVYVILKTFLRVPPKTVTIQLSELKALSGSPTFGRILEATLAHLTGHDLVIVPLLENYRIGCKLVEEPLQVHLYSSEMRCSVNQIIAVEVAAANSLCNEGENTTFLRGDVFQNGIISHFTKDGNVWIRFKSRIQKLIRDYLKGIFDNWSSFSLFRHQSQDVQLLQGQVCVAIHPEKQKLLRCKVLAKSPNLARKDCKSVPVLWIDYGDECSLQIGDILPIQSLSRILNESKPLAKQFHLANIKCLTSNYLQSLVATKAEVTLRVVDVSSPMSKQLSQVQLVVMETKRSESTVRLSKICINERLLKRRWAESTTTLSIFMARNCVQPNGLCNLSMEYPSTEWIDNSPVEDQTLIKGSQISFYVSKFLRDKFIIHPWSTKFALENVQMTLFNFYENVEWVKKERACSENQIAPYGNFCAYVSKDGQWHRAKILKNIYREVATSVISLVELLLIDLAVVETVEYKSLWRLIPIGSVTSLGPQGAIARLNLNNKTDCGVLESDRRQEKTVKPKLDQFSPKIGERVCATLEDFEIDSDGKASMTLRVINGSF